MLVFEYLPNGNVCGHLYGKHQFGKTVLIVFKHGIHVNGDSSLDRYWTRINNKNRVQTKAFHSPRGS